MGFGTFFVFICAPAAVLSTSQSSNKRRRLELPPVVFETPILDIRLAESTVPPISKEALSSYAIVDQCSGFETSDRHSIFSQEASACLRSDLSSTGHSGDCTDVRLIRLDDGTSVSVGNEIGRGGYAYVYATNRTDVVIKISIKRPMCSEKAILSILRDSDITPTIFPFTRDSSISPYCHARIVLMSRVGEIDWDKAYSPLYTPNQPAIFVSYCRIARLLQIIKQLHLSGFVHRDIHDENVRLSSTDARKIWLIDFGKVRYLTDEDRVNDLRAATKLAPLNDQHFNNFRTFFNHNDYKFSNCDYDRWIDYFSKLAMTQNHFTDCI